MPRLRHGYTRQELVRHEHASAPVVVQPADRAGDVALLDVLPARQASSDSLWEARVTVHWADPQSGAHAETPLVICRTPVPSARITTTFADLANVIHFPSGEKEPVTTTFPG